MGAILVVAVLLAVALTGAQAQQMYRWVDRDGRVHYTQQPPPADAKNVQRRSASVGTAESSNLPYATRVAAQNFPVTLFTSAECQGPCKDGRESLEKRGIPFEEVVVGDEKSVEELKRAAGGAQVPVLRVGRQVAVGFEPNGWKSALDAAGYPASGPPLRARARPETPKQLPPVKLYIRADCGNLCEDARKLLAARKVSFQEVDVSAPETVADLTKLAGAAVVPVLVVGERVQRGFDAGFYHGLLDGAGFPRATPAAGGAPATK